MLLWAVDVVHSRSGTGLDLRPGSAEPRHAGVKSGPVAEPWRERGSSGSLSPDTPLRRQPLSIREEVERLMEDQDREHHSQSPIPSTQASRAKQVRVLRACSGAMNTLMNKRDVLHNTA